MASSCRRSSSAVSPSEKKSEITTDNRIHLKLRPQVSSLDFANAVTLQGYLIPAIATRFAETEAILNDGESFAVAGLIDNRVIQSMSRVKWTPRNGNAGSGTG